MHTLMHKNEIVLEVTEEGKVTVINEAKIPFDFRHYGTITYEHWLNWMKRRFSTLTRTYMSQLYKQRRVGRSNEAIIQDSGGISPVDLFWIQTKNTTHTWDSLQIMRDEKLSTAKVSLTGELDKSYNIFREKPKDHISIFTTKGAFPKAILQGHLLKKGDNAEYEVSAYKLGYRLGVNVAKAEMGDEGIVACELFTDGKKSLAHMIEFVYPFNENSSDTVHADAYKKLSHNKSFKQQLEVLYMFNYLVTNTDMHEENFGVLYDTETFEVTEVAPAFDFNSAFEVWGDNSVFYEWVYDNLSTFVNNNYKFVGRLESINEILQEVPYLTSEQKQSVADRARYLLSLRSITTQLQTSNTFDKK